LAVGCTLSSRVVLATLDCSAKRVRVHASLPQRRSSHQHCSIDVHHSRSSELVHYATLLLGVLLRYPSSPPTGDGDTFTCYRPLIYSSLAEWCCCGTCPYDRGGRRNMSEWTRSALTSICCWVIDDAAISFGSTHKHQ
jgi:hypothetical protein